MNIEHELEVLGNYKLWYDGDSGSRPSENELHEAIDTVLQWHKDNEVKLKREWDIVWGDEMKLKEPIKAVSEPQTMQSQIKLAEPITIEAGNATFVSNGE